MHWISNEDLFKLLIARKQELVQQLVYINCNGGSTEAITEHVITVSCLRASIGEIDALLANVKLFPPADNSSQDNQG